MKRHLYLLCFLLLSLLVFRTTVSAQDTAITNLPTLYITTENGVPITSEDVYVKGNLFTAGGSKDSGYYDGKIEIRGRGNSSWTFDKKPYKIKLDKKYNLLGMTAKAKDWVLLANYADKTLMRNALAFEVSKLFGFAFTPSYRMADVVLNGDYIGTYTITDQVEQGPDRVDVEDLDDNDTALAKITGGYMLETGNQPLWDSLHYDTKRGMHYSIKYPDNPDDINEAQKNYITSYIQKFEDVLYSPGYKNATTGYRRYMDMKSLVDGWLVNEVCGNGDCFHSNNMYKHRDDSALYTGPMWDYDIAFDNDYRLGDTKYKYMFDWAFGPRINDYGPRVWYGRINDDEYFYRQVKQRFFEVKKAGLQQRMLYVIDSLSALLNQSQKLNFQRWPILNTYVFMNPVALGSYDKEVKYLRSFVSAHVAWLNGEYTGLPSGTPVNIVSQLSGKGLQIRNGATTAGNDVVQYTLNGTPSQRWSVTNLNNGYYTITNLNSGMVMTNNELKANNLTLQQAPYLANKPGQQWRIINTGNKVYGFVNRLSGYVADLAFESLADNAYIMQHDNQIYDVKPNQHWLFKTAAPAIVATTDTSHVSFTLSPNPATGGSVTARITLLEDAVVSVFVYDARGLPVQEIQKGKLPAGTTNVTVSTGRLYSGNYTVTVQAGEEKVSQVLIK